MYDDPVWDKTAKLIELGIAFSHSSESRPWAALRPVTTRRLWRFDWRNGKMPHGGAQTLQSRTVEDGRHDPRAAASGSSGRLESLLDVRTKAKARTAPLALFVLLVFAVLLFLATSRL